MEELFKTVYELQNALQNMPNNSTKEIEIGGIKLVITKGEVEEDFDDSETKEIVESYKQSLEGLDDEIFLDALEDISEALDINEFNKLLSLDKYSEVEAETVESMIGVTSDIISNKLQERIQALLSMLDKF